MKKSALVFFIVSLASGIFGYWGMCTKSGRTAYDEMAGIIPELAAVTSFIFFIVFLIFVLIILFKKNKNAA